MKKLLAVALLSISALTHAWEPTKTVTVIVGNTPGAGNQIAFRKLAEIVQKQNPKFVYVVQNIPGADSTVANNKFLTEPNDGYTINLPSHMSSYVTNDIWEKLYRGFLPGSEKKIFGTITSISQQYNINKKNIILIKNI